MESEHIACDIQCREEVNYYICGSNLYGQITQACTDVCDEERFCTSPVVLHNEKGKLEKVSFTWSQIWAVKDDEKLTFYGFNSDKMVSSLQRLTNGVKQIVTLPLATYIQTELETYMVTEDCSGIKEVVCEINEDTNICLLSGTDKKVIGMNDTGHLCEANACITGTDGTLLQFTVLGTVPSKSVSTVHCGHEHILILSTEGEVLSYGSNSRGQLGHGELSVDEVHSPKLVSTLDGVHVTSVCAGGWHSVAVTVDWDIYVWGWNEKGQLGLPCPNVGKTEKKGEHLRSNQGSDKHVKEQEETKCWPVSDIPLELHQDIEPSLIQTLPYGLDMPDDMAVKKAACGSRHTCILLDSGVVMTAGWNSYGQLGLGDCEDRDYFKAVSDIADRGLKATDIAGGSWNTVIETETTGVT